MFKIVGLLFLVIVVAVILSDYQKTRAEDQAAQQHKAAVDADPVRALPISPGQNDPYRTNAQSQLEVALALVPAIAGAAASVAAASASRGVVSSEVGVVRGAAGSPVSSNEEILAAIRASQHGAAGAGETIGAQSAGVGGAIGSAVPSLLAGIQSGIVSAVDASRSLPGGPKDVYEVPIAGAVYRGEDWLGSLFGRRP